MQMKQCWEMAGCSGQFEGCKARSLKRSCWHFRGGFSNCPFAKATGRVCELKKAQLEQEKALVELARQQRQEAFEEIAREFSCHVKKASRRFFMPGAEREDIQQEALVGLNQAVRTFDAGYGRTLAEHIQMCLRNSVVRAVRGATRKKHLVLTKSVDFEDLHPSSLEGDPSGEVEGKMMVETLIKNLKQQLSSFEIDSLASRVKGETVQEISARCGVPAKKVENALFRARQKAKQILAA